jgi:hypothetical protein
MGRHGQALIAIEWSLRSEVSHTRLRAKFIAIAFLAQKTQAEKPLATPCAPQIRECAAEIAGVLMWN